MTNQGLQLLTLQEEEDRAVVGEGQEREEWAKGEEEEVHRLSIHPEGRPKFKTQSLMEVPLPH